MDDDKDDKSLIEKTIESVKHIAHIASDAAKHAMEPEPLKPGDEVVMMPTADYGMFSPRPTPQFMVVHHPRKSRAEKAATAKSAAKKTAKKSAQKTAKKTAAKKWKSPAKAPAKKTTGRKAVKKKKAKRSRR